MSIFNIRQWLDRISEHPNRRTLTNVEDQTDVKTYDLSRAEGEVSVQGTALTAANLNDLESRIASAFTAVENAMPEANPAESASGSLTKLKVNGTVYDVEGTSVEKGTVQNVAIASFTDGADNVPVSSLIVDIDAVQAGSGTPSPDNVRPITGHSTCTIKVNDDIDDPQTEITTAIALGQTVYGGSLNVSTGELTITHGYVDLGVQTWFSGGGSFYDTADIGAESSTMDIIATSYPCESSAYFENHIDIVGLSISASRKVRFYNSDATSPSDVQTLLNGCYLCYKLATPTTATLTPTEVRTLLGNNNIFADTGNINELVYFKTGCEALARLIEAYECYTEVAGTLAAGQTSITLTNDAITSNSTIDVYTDADVDYISISVTSGSVTITFEAQASNLNVKVRIS